MKPVFTSKQEREKLALERRLQEAQEKRRQVDLVRSQLVAARQSAVRTAPYPSTSKTTSTTSSTLSKTRSSIDRMVVSEKKRKQKSSERQFSFEWDASEDTSAIDSTDPLYTNRVNSLLFGRGQRGGYADIKTRKNKDEQSWRDKPLSKMDTRDYRIMREEYQISVKGGHVPPPIRSWDEAHVSYRILDLLDDIGYRKPTPIQRQAIPIGLMNRDLLGIAETGSGKTAAFLVPMLEFILRLPPLEGDRVYDGPYALIMAPTRELAQQIEKEATKFANRLGLTCLSIVGGHSLEEQTNKIRRGAHIIIATPGRLRDLLDRRILVLNQCTYVVLDEADRMVVDMGFEADLEYILSAFPVSNTKPDTEDAELTEKMMDDGLPIYRQTTMFSATMPPAVERVARDYMRRPAVVTVGEVGSAALTITQHIEMVNEDKKEAKLMSILSNDFEPPIIIFVKQKIGVDALAKILEREGLRVATLHGGKSQEMRESALQSVKSGSRDILVATDVAGRGIDIADVSLVINYDMPKTIEDYTHRIGRTGRAGKSGVAISLVTPEDEHLFFDLKNMLKKTNNVVPRALARHEASRGNPSALPAFKKKSEETLYLDNQRQR